ncbi:MAG TPA: RNA polymerase sigma factor, partial [Ilumatobacteraceae bacterium]|nr:RNA polymerase sigma factor [Ilumatobacteraceae bacterium]
MVTAEELTGFGRGDPDGVRAVYRAYGGMVFAVCLRALGSRDLAGEAAQQTFVNAWRGASAFDTERDLGPWLATIARRASIDIHRREARRQTTNLDDVHAGHASIVELPVDIGRSYEVAEVRAAIDSLPDDEREVVRLQHLEQLTQPEVAERLAVPLGTVKSRSFRAHRH